MSSDTGAGSGGSRVQLSSSSPEARGSIYRKLFVIPHPLYVFQGPERSTEIFAPGKPTGWPDLVLTQCQPHEDEARAVLYGSNHFHFVDTSPREAEVLQSFIASIGPQNARLISHVSLSFPTAEAETESVEGQLKETRIREDGLRSLKILHDQCRHLKTLELSVHHKNSSGLVEGASIHDLRIVQQAIPKINNELTALSSLDKVIIRFDFGRPNPLIQDLMQNLRWIILTGNREIK